MKFTPIEKPIWVTDKKGKSFEKFAKTCRAVWHGRFAPHDEAAKKKQAVEAPERIDDYEVKSIVGWGFCGPTKRCIILETENGIYIQEYKK